MCCSGSPLASQNPATLWLLVPQIPPSLSLQAFQKIVVLGPVLPYLVYLSPADIPGLHPCFIVCFNCENLSATLIS